MNGYIVKGIGGFYYVKTPDGIVECKPRGIFRKQKITPVAGDEVTLETENGAAVIAQIEPRKNVFVRPPVANLDVLFLVASTTQLPPVRWFWISFRPLRWIRRTAGGGVYQKRPCRGGFSGKRLCKVHSAVYPHRLRKRCRSGRSKAVDQRQIVRFLRQLRCG